MPPPPSTSLFFLLPFRTHSRTLSTRASSQSTVEGIKCVVEARNFKGTPCRFHSISVLCILRISPRTPFRRSLVNNKSYGPGQPIWSSGARHATSRSALLRRAVAHITPSHRLADGSHSVRCLPIYVETDYRGSEPKEISNTLTLVDLS